MPDRRHLLIWIVAVLLTSTSCQVDGGGSSTDRPERPFRSAQAPGPPPTAQTRVPARVANHRSARTEALILQLESDPEIHRTMTGYLRPVGLFQCGLEIFGRSRAESRLFAWVMCFDYRQGATAKPLSGSRLAMALAITGRGAKTRLVSFDTPRDNARQIDIPRIFPPKLRRQASECGGCRPSPGLPEMLEVAREHT